MIELLAHVTHSEFPLLTALLVGGVGIGVGIGIGLGAYLRYFRGR